jgi:hypothetical protein
MKHELGGDGRGGEIIHCSNRQMTQQTAPKCWGMILGWIRRDNCENEYDRSHTDPIEWSMYFKGFVSELLCASVIDGQLLLEQFNNEQPLRYLPK